MDNHNKFITINYTYSQKENSKLSEEELVEKVLTEEDKDKSSKINIL